MSAVDNSLKNTVNAGHITQITAMKIKTLLSLLLCTAFASTAFGQVVTLQPGTIVHYRTTHNYKALDMEKNEVLNAGSNTAIYRFKLLEKLPDGRLRVESTLLDCRNIAGDMNFDARRLTEASVNSTSNLFQLALLQEPVELVIGNGPAEQPALRALLRKQGTAWSIREEYNIMMASGISVYLLKETGAVFFRFPQQPERQGNEWLSPDSTLKYSLSAASGGIRHITATSNPAAKGYNKQQEYRLEHDWDERSGKITRAFITQRITDSANINGGKRTFRYADTLLLELLDDPGSLPRIPAGLKDMLAISSTWSDALKDGFDTDSAKFAAFTQRFDPQFRHEKRYVQLKLDMIQQLAGRDHHNVYDDSLKATPNYLLEGASTHLHNKLQSVSSRDADSAIVLLHYISKARASSFANWMQHSFAQHLFPPADRKLDEAIAFWREKGVPEKRIAEMIYEANNSERVAGLLINKMIADEDSVIRNAAYPMYLTNTARKTRDTDSLRDIIRQFKSLSPAIIKSGNANRYALMLSRQLLDSGRTAMADELLNDAIGKLEKGAEDSLSNTRYADKNMLAHAYKLKYDRLVKTNRKEAFVYLAKAAAASPQTPEESVHDSFYDRVFLQSKESYRRDFSDELLKEGATKEALQVLSQQISAEPGMLPEVQQSFKQYLPERDFSEFLHEAVIKSWDMAPDFTLQGAEGEIFKLSDYAGKWLLLDFWGTWCQPCREELPEINKMVARIKDDPEKAFLSIACFDTPEKVKTFFRKEGYALPVAMSDQKVQENYGVKGYPSKFLISPEGKMIFLRYGSEWEKVFELFSNIKPGAAAPGDKKTTVSKDLQ